MLKTNAIDSLTTLRYSIILSIEHLIINIIATILFKSLLYNTPSITFVVIQHSFDIFKDENFGLTLNYYAGKFAE